MWLSKGVPFDSHKFTLLYSLVAEFASEFLAFSTNFGLTILEQHPKEPLSKGTPFDNVVKKKGRDSNGILG